MAQFHQPDPAWTVLGDEEEHDQEFEMYDEEFDLYDEDYRLDTLREVEEC